MMHIQNRSTMERTLKELKFKIQPRLTVGEDVKQLGLSHMTGVRVQVQSL